MDQGALAHPWSVTFLYAFPPIPPLNTPQGRTIQSHSSACGILTSKGMPWPLPLRQDLLAQLEGSKASVASLIECLAPFI